MVLQFNPDEKKQADRLEKTDVFEKQPNGLYTRILAEDGSRIPDCDFHEQFNPLGYRETVYNDGRVQPSEMFPSLTREPSPDSYYLYTQRVQAKLKAELVAAGKKLQGKVSFKLNDNWHKYEEVARAAYFANAVNTGSIKTKKGWVAVSYNNTMYPSYAAAHRATGTSVAKIKKLVAKGLEGWSFANTSTSVPTGAKASTKPGKKRGFEVSYNSSVYPSYAAAQRATGTSVARIKKLAANGLDGWNLV